MTAAGAKKLRDRWIGPFTVSEVHGDLNVQLAIPAQWRMHPVFHVNRLRRAHVRDADRFPGVEHDEDQHASADLDDLNEYDERGAAIAQVERDEKQPTTRPRTRAAFQSAHDRGERHDYLELRDAWSERRQSEQSQRATDQRDDRISHQT